jgi:hypothetical protein
VIRLIDALAVQKNLDGSLAALQWSDLSIEEAEGLGTTVGALLGLGPAARPEWRLEPSPGGRPGPTVT